MLILFRLILFVVGVAIVGGTLLSAIRTFVLPRSVNDPLTRAVFIVMRRIFNIPLGRAKTYARRDAIMALYPAVSLLVLAVVWLTLVAIGYMVMYLGLGAESLSFAFTLSGSSLLTLGFAPIDSMPKTLLAFSEAIIGLILIALLISYLPTIYGAFARRELMVTLLEVRAGSPPSAVEMLLRFHNFHGLNELSEHWTRWEEWFADIQESHTSLAVLSFFRSPRPEHSWITAAGCVLDSAALSASTLDIPLDPHSHLCIRAGYLALRHIADFFGIPYNPTPRPDDPISISREEYNAVYDYLKDQGAPVKLDQDQAWRDFVGWRVNYDIVLRALAGILVAPYAPWSSDRPLPPRRFSIKRSTQDWQAEAPPPALSEQ